MLKKLLRKCICLLLTAVSTVVIFSDGVVVSALDGEVENQEVVAEEDIDPKHIQFVTRLYAIVTRQDHADEQEKLELATSLKGGLQAAYKVMFHFYFSDEYRALNVSDEQFVEDLYTGTRARYADDYGKEYYLDKLDEGYSRYLIFREFIDSNEFVRLCYDYNIRVKQILLENYIDHLDGMTCICDNYYDLDEDGDLDYCYENAAKHARCINEFYYTSPTDYFIFADIDNCYIMIFKGSVGQWSLYMIYPMSCGRTGSETPRGYFEVTGKLPYFYSHGSLCYYATQWYGPYYLHSVTYNYNGTIQNPTLGAHVSAGCIRLRIDVAEWIYDNIPEGTPVKTI